MKNKNMRQSELLSPIVEMKYDVKTTVYCKKWSYSKYPMDTQTCRLSIGSGSLGAVYVLYDRTMSHHLKNIYEAANALMIIDFFDEKLEFRQIEDCGTLDCGTG